MQAGVGLADWSSSQGAGPGRALGCVAERNGESVRERETEIEAWSRVFWEVLFVD